MAAAASLSHADKVVLVTGGGGGLGRAIAEHFLTIGAQVVICDINADLLADYETKVAAGAGAKTLAVKTDITDEAALDDLFAKIESTYGRLDVVVNSAGIMDRFDPAGSTDRSLMEKVLAVNLIAPTMITKRAVNVMLAKGIKGAIVNIASIASYKGYASGAAYTASKHGLAGLTKNTAAFYRLKGIRCNAIQCGAMKTNISSSMAAGYCEEGLALSMKHFGDWEGGWADLDKVAKLCAYLSTDDSEMINGALINAEGGITAV